MNVLVKFRSSYDNLLTISKTEYVTVYNMNDNINKSKIRV